MVTPDGKWVIVSKAEEESGEYNRIVRINLLTRREFPINLPPADSVRPAAFVYSHNKVLVYRGKRIPITSTKKARARGREEGDVPPRLVKPDLTPAIPEYYLVDAVTGAVQRVRGEVRPLESQTYRPLQPTGVASEFWAAVYDENTKSTSIGRYSDKTFTFRPVMNVPNINLDSMDIWVDEPGAKVYFVYEGHLLGSAIEDSSGSVVRGFVDLWFRFPRI